MGVEDRYKKKREEEEKSNTLYNGVENRYLYKNAETVGKEISNRVNKWLTNNKYYISNAQHRFSGNNTTFRTDASDWLTTVTSQRENFQKEAESIKSVLTQYKDFFGDDYVNSVFKALDGNLKAQESVLDASTKDVEYWSQWTSEDEYYTAQRILGYQNKYDGKSYEEIVAALGKLNDGEEKEWLNSRKYDYIKNSPDYDNTSASGWETYLSDDEKDRQEALYGKEDEKWYETLGRWLGSGGAVDTTLPLSGTTQVTHDLRNDTSYMEPANNWTDEQKDIYGYLYATDKGAASAYAQSTTEANNQAEKEQKIAAIEEWSTKNGFNSAVATLASIALMPMSLVDTLSALTEYNARGFVSTSADPMPGEISNAITGAVSSTLNEKGTLDDSIPVIGGKGLGDAYQLGVSIANSMLTAYTQGTVGTYMVFFGSASASGMHEAKKRGATDEQAITYGILGGLAEAAGEAFSVDNLLSIAGAKEVSNFFLDVLKQAGVEASEEGVTTLLNNFADQLVMGDKSNFNAMVKLLMTQDGLSEEEAKKKAWLSMANDLAFDMLGGAISGGVSGGIQSGIGSVINSANDTALGKEYKEKFGANIGGALADEAVEINPNSKFAQSMQNKVESGNSLSNRQVGKLVRQNEATMYENDVAAIQSAAENRLTALGEKGNVKVIAAAITKQVQGERLTFTERKVIKSSTFGQRVANELNTENIRSGEYSTAWAEQIGTDRINAEEYGRLLQSLEAEASPETATAQAPINAQSAARAEAPASTARPANAANPAELAPGANVDRQAYTARTNAPDTNVGSIAATERANAPEANAGDKTYTPKADMPETNVGGSAALEKTNAPEANVGSKDALEKTNVPDTNVGGKATVEKTDAPDTNVGHKADVAAEAKTAAENAHGVAENTTAKERPAEAKFEASDEVARTEEKPVTLEDASKKYGAQAGAMISTYTEGQDVAKYDAAYSAAYNMGKGGVALSYAMNSGATAYLTESQRELAHAAGADASSTTAKTQAEANKAKANGKTGRRKGTVRGEGVKIDDLRKAFNDTQGKAYKLLTTYAEATGVDIVLYQSKANADGKFEGAQGKFKWSEDTIYIDINAGIADTKSVDDLAKYTMMRTFSHEFTHFIEKWNPIWYNEFRKVVFDTLTERGENVEDLIDTKMAQSEGMTYDKASREVVAEAMTDILPDANFVEELANNHKNIFAKLLEKLKEFVADLKAYFSSIDKNSSREANALKEQIGESVKYVENIVKLFDKVAVEAVANYQATVATDIETNTDGGINHAEQRAEQEEGSETVHTGGNSTVEATRREDENRSGVSEGNGEIRGVSDRSRGRRGLNSEEYRYPKESFITPKSGTVEAEEIAKLAAYGVEGYVVKKSAWDRKAQATSSNGRVYIREGIDEKYRGIVAAHEVTHVMKQLQFQPYLDFIERTPDLMNQASKYAQIILEHEAAHRNIDLFDMDDAQRTNLYDEVNATVYGHYAAGQIFDSEFDLDWVPNAFNNFDAYTKELTDILEQFKAANAPQKTAESPVAEVKPVAKKESTNKPVRTKKSDWASHDVEWGVPGKKTPIAYSTVAASDLIEALAEDNPSATIKDLLGKVTYDEEAKKVLQQYIDAGYGDQVANEWFNHDKKENANVENVDNAGAVQQSDADRQGDSRVLDEVQAEDVQGNAPRGDSVGDAVERGQETGRDGADADHGAGTGGRSGDGDRQSGDLRGNDGLTTHEAAKAYAEEKGYRIEINKLAAKKNIIQVDIYDKQGLPTINPVIIGELGKTKDGNKWNEVKEAIDRREAADNSATDTNDGGKLHEEVTEQIAQQSTENPKGRNFVIGESLDLPNGEKARYKANIEAIKLVKQLEAENRYATEAEQQILSKYVGWGGLANAFDQRKTEWAKEFTELKELLTEEEYASARGSTLNAHYTDISVIKAMYDGLAKLGFDGGRMLEPSSGVGNFVGAMPTEMSAKVKSWTMVELDGITGLIAKYLYPNADVRIQGFEKANIPDNYMDVIISNVPFGKYAVMDKKYPKKVTDAIHNYFFAKSLDKVRPGGIVMFITSSYTMNAKETAVRRYMMQRADLLGAIRLPDSAFKGNAGTEVVTDILVLKKRAENTAYAGEEFLEAPWTRLEKESYNGAYINSYFTNHPEMVLGAPTMDGGMYRGGSLTYKALEGRGSLADQIREAFSHIEGKMEYPATLSREKTNFAVERANKKTKENGLVVKDGKVYQNKGGDLVEVDKAKGAAERITGMLEIRDLARNLMNYQQQGLNETEIKKARTALNKAYDAFVKKYGFINSQANRNAFIEDPDRYSLFALENWNPETKKATKADIFSKNTIAPNRTVTSAKDVSEGLIVSVNQTGGVDTALIAKLTGIAEADVTRELIDSRKAFKNRNGDLEAAEVYLSGNVRAKLRDAEALVPIDGDYAHNVEALKAVMPEDVGYQDIFVNPGTPWIPNSVYSDFAAYMLGSRNTDWRQAVDITRNAETGNFTVELKDRYLKTNAANTQKWGTSRRTFLELFDAMLNSKSVVIKDKLDDGSFVINKDATAAANEKIENITKEFQEWLWKDEARRTELATLYNEVFNSVVTPKYNGDNLTVNGANALKPLRPHQRNAVQRVISSGGNTLLAHKVGAGKTYEMAAAAMKLKELGLVKKPMFAVPKSLVAQWGNEFIDFFPTAKLLVAEASDFTAANRKVFMNRIANGEYDAVIVSYEQFEKLPMSDDFTRQLYQEQIDSVIAAIEEAKADKGDKALSVKDLEKKRKSLQTKIDKLTDKAKDEGNIDFEQLGVDSLFVDEAHNFKNLFYTTSMTNVAGLGNKDGSKRAFDLYTKVRYLQQLNGGRGIVFATATPVMNSMSEMYIMQKYLQPDLLNQLGLNTFDAWAKQFGEVVNGVEIKPSGQGYRVKQSFSRFKNMSELQLLFRNFADVLTDIPGLKIPKMKGGKVNVVVCEPGQFQQDFMKELEQRADNIKNVDPSVDNMLKITSDGRKISYTQRMIDPSLPYEEGCKIYRCADNVIKEYNDSKANKGTQIIFCDMATPKGKSDNNTDTEDIETDMESAQLYDDLKTRLRQGGIPAKEIAFIHEADTDQKKKKLFADVNDGKVRVLIGSTGKMGVGMNAQKRIVAIHHLDAPWRPGDVEQRDGRAFRQGNINDEVSKYTYVTEGSFDARLWDILDRKQNFINQIMNGESVGRDAEDTGEVTLSAAEVKALASGSPLIMEQVQLDTDIKKLESLYRAHVSAVRSAKERLLSDSGKIASLEKQVANGEADMLATVDTYSEGRFSMTVGSNKYADKKDAGVALMAAAAAKATPDAYTKVGTFAGFELRVIKTSEGISGLLVGKQGYPFKTYPGNHVYMINHIIGVVESIGEKVKLWEHNLTELQADIAEQEKLIAAPFAKQAELDQKRARYIEVMDILNPKEEQSLDSVAEDTVQEQSREYLGDVQEQQRTTTLNDREVLALAADALEATELTDAERDALQIFRDRLTKLEELQDERKKQGALYKEQQFGTKVDREAAAQTLNRMHVLDEQIKAASAAVLSVEDKKVLGDVLKKARKVVEAEQRSHDAEILKRYRDRTKDAAAIKKYRDRITADVEDLYEWLMHPMNKDVTKHVNENVKDIVIDFLLSIDQTSGRRLRGGAPTKADEKHDKKAQKLLSMLNGLDEETRYSGEYDLPLNFESKLARHVKTVQDIMNSYEGDTVLNQMTAEELRNLSIVTANLKAALTTMNKFHTNAMFAHVTTAGDNTVRYLKKLRDSDGNEIDNFIMWKNIRPDYVWDRFGDGGRSINLELRAGQDKLAWNAKAIVDYAQATFTEKEREEWENEAISVTLSGDREIKVTAAALMSFYELSKRKQGREHILNGGVTVSDVEIRENKKKQRVKGRYGKFTEADIDIMKSKLTDRQKEVADKLQQFMEKQGGEWGNHVTLARFGEKAFGEKGYFPISVDKQSLNTKTDDSIKGADLYRLLNMGFTKELSSNTKQPLMIYSIFDVFSTHMADMAQYNAMALPVLDAIRWLNYKNIDLESGVETSNLRAELKRAFGAPLGKNGDQLSGYAESFIAHILQAYNGTEARGTPEDAWGVGFMHRYNRAQIAYNMRVVVQQPMALTRAALVINPKYITKALDPTKLKANIEDMLAHSGIAVWKDLGYYDINISRGLTQMIKQDETFLDKVTEIGMKPAELADKATWAVMWYACKLQLADRGITDYEQINKLFDDVIYKTQVVDSVLTKSQYMRDKGFLARTTSAFMSEPVTTASMVLGAYDDFRMDLRKGMSVGQAWSAHKTDIGKMVLVYSVSTIMLAMVQAAADALRDDDDYQDFLEKWYEAFKGNIFDELTIVNKIPLVGYSWDLLKIGLDTFTDLDVYGNTPGSALTQWFDTSTQLMKIVKERRDGESNYTWYAELYKLLQVVSGAWGLPIAAGFREVATVWNNTFGVLYPDLKLKTYDPGDMSEIKYAYADGYLTYDEAVAELLEQGHVDNEDEAYFTMQGWEAGEGYSRYDKVYEAVRNGANMDDAMNELLSHGYTEKQVTEQITSKVGEWYRGGEISKQQATDMLTKYTDKSSEDITKAVNKWSSYVVTGIEYNDIGDEVIAGNITASRAIEMYMRYGGMTKEEATEKVSVHSFVKDHPSLGDESISYGFVTAYTEYCEPQGIDVNVFHDVWQFKGSAKADTDKHGKVIPDSAKQKVLAYIESLGLSKKQMDGLYYALGYAKSTIKDAPWH